MNASYLLKYSINKFGIGKATVMGISMYPYIRQGDLVLIKPDDYKISDILVFNYLDEGMLIHRLLKMRNDMYYCKGDNTFRLEQVRKSDVIGKVVCIIREHKFIGIQEVDNTFIELSYKISKQFRLCGYDKQKIIETEIYNYYKKKYLNI